MLRFEENIIKFKSIPKKAKRLFDYEPSTGILYWRSRPLSDFKSKPQWKRWNTRFAGTEAGTINSYGYKVIRIDGIQYQAHRIIAYLVKGWNRTDKEIDHRYGNRSDNRLEMIRPATHSENGRSRKLHSNNTSGYKGVSFNKANGKWEARINIDGKQKHLGYFNTAYEAHLSYEKAAKKYFGKFRRKH